MVDPQGEIQSHSSLYTSHTAYTYNINKVIKLNIHTDNMDDKRYAKENVNVAYSGGDPPTLK